MARTGQPGGRQTLENTRVQGPIHEKPPSVETAPQIDDIRNASVLRGTPNTNRSYTTPKPPEVQKDFPVSGVVEYAKPGKTTPNTNRY